MSGSDEPDQHAAESLPPSPFGGEFGGMRERIAHHDWAATPLGPASGWSQTLAGALNLCLDLPLPTAIFWGADSRILYNDAYAPILTERHPGALGQPGAQVWADAWEVIGPQFEQIRATGRGFSTGHQRFDLVRGGRVTETYWQYSFSPIRDESSRVVGIFNSGTETTDQVLASRRRDVEIDQLREMFEQAPGYIAVHRGPEHVFELANRAYRQLVGNRPLLGLPFRVAMPEVDQQGFPALMDLVYATGTPHNANRAYIELVGQPGGRVTTHYFDFVYQPITDPTGAVSGIFVAGKEVTEQVRAEVERHAANDLGTFRARLSDALRDLTHPSDVMAVAAEHLGRHLGVDRVHYAEVDEAITVAIIDREWKVDTVRSTVGSHPLAVHAPIVSEMMRGQTVLIGDIASDSRTVNPAQQAVLRGVDIAALMNVPLLKGGRLVAFLALHCATPRLWSSADAALAQEVAERTWAAVERARAETSLRRTNARLRLALRGGRIGTWDLDLATRRLECSPTCKANYGRQPGDPFTYDDLAASVVEADRPGWLATIADAIAYAADFEVEYGVRWPDGSLRWVQVRGNCVADGSGTVIGLSGVSLDITERRRAAERDRQAAAEVLAAAEANAKFRAFFDQGWYFASILAPDGTVIEVNRVGTEGTGFTRADFITKKFWDVGVWGPDATLRNRMKQAILGAATGQPFHAEMPYFLADGSERCVVAHLTPVLDDAGQILFVVASGVDITDRKQAEDALRRLAADLSEADHRKDEFLAMLGHELRNPLAAISGVVQLAEITAMPELLGEYRDMIQRQVVHLTRLIDDLLDVSRITQGKIVLQLQTVALASTARRAIDLVQPIIAARRHTLTVNLPTPDVQFVADPTRAEQILGNLLTNAAKYTEPGGQIDLSARVEETEVVFRVRDTGVGISAAMLPEVFGLFTQVNATIDRAQGGLGIGLTLVRNLVEMHGGTTTAASAGPGQGSEFTVRLPIGQPSARAALDPPVAPHPVGTGRILVVDDNRDTARLTARMLRHAGFEVETAHDGLDAIELAPQLQPSFILLDIGLPGMNGYEVATALRRDDRCKDATIIAISGYGEDKARERSTAAGFDHHLAKPVDFHHLMTLISV